MSDPATIATPQQQQQQQQQQQASHAERVAALVEAEEKDARETNPYTAAAAAAKQEEERRKEAAENPHGLDASSPNSRVSFDRMLQTAREWAEDLGDDNNSKTSGAGVVDNSKAEAELKQLRAAASAALDKMEQLGPKFWLHFVEKWIGLGLHPADQLPIAYLKRHIASIRAMSPRKAHNYFLSGFGLSRDEVEAAFEYRAEF